MHPGSELSPPDSQDHNATVPMGDMMDLTEHAGAGEAGVIEPGTEGGGGGVVGGQEEKEPGWGWKNKKAQEDWGRALEMVVDRGFSLRECSLGVWCWGVLADFVHMQGSLGICSMSGRPMGKGSRSGNGYDSRNR